MTDTHNDKLETLELQNAAREAEIEALAARIEALQSERSSMEGEIAERVAVESERYGEGLVPKLRVVCTWLADHFRHDEDTRAALNRSAKP